MNYLLIVFGKSEKQEEFVETLCKDVSIMSDLGDVKYYYGPESVILTFKCSELFDSISGFLDLLYGKMNLVYILLPYETDKMSLKMDNDISKHLFDVEKNDEKSEKKSEIENLVQELFNKAINSEEFNSELEHSDEYEKDEIEDLLSKKLKPKAPTLDELLDKINSTGILSLSKKELTLLNNYSK